jgi:hypothetical protein
MENQGLDSLFHGQKIGGLIESASLLMVAGGIGSSADGRNGKFLLVSMAVVVIGLAENRQSGRWPIMPR